MAIKYKVINPYNDVESYKKPRSNKFFQTGVKLLMEMKPVVLHISWKWPQAVEKYSSEWSVRY